MWSTFTLASCQFTCCSSLNSRTFSRTLTCRRWERLICRWSWRRARLWSCKVRRSSKRCWAWCTWPLQTASWAGKSSTAWSRYWCRQISTTSSHFSWNHMCRRTFQLILWKRSSSGRRRYWIFLGLVWSHFSRWQMTNSSTCSMKTTPRLSTI